MLAVALAAVLLTAPAAMAAPGDFSEVTIYDNSAAASGWASVSANSDSHFLDMCTYPQYPGVLNVDIDPGNGHLINYTTAAGGNSCVDRQLFYAMRKYRAWVWSLPPRLLPNEASTIWVYDDNVQNYAGYAQILTNQAGTSRSLLVCTYNFYNGNVYAEIDPGNGVLQTYAATPSSGCYSRALGTATRKFRVFIWQLTG